ncbi:MAG: ABC transporter permease, partial [Candidatus Competibacterales bacterium]
MAPLRRRLPGPSHGYLAWLWLRRDLKTRYADSIGGGLWALLAPLATIALFYLVFARILQVRIPRDDGAPETGFFFFLLAGFLPWLAIGEGLSRAAGSLVAQEQFLQKMTFPLGLIPATVVVSSAVPQVVGTVVLALLLLSHGEGLAWRWLWWPLLLGWQLLACLGLGLALAVVSVHLRDLLQALPVVLQLLFYAAPILYPKALVPEAYHPLFWLHPFAGFIECYHALFLGWELSLA